MNHRQFIILYIIALILLIDSVLIVMSHYHLHVELDDFGEECNMHPLATHLYQINVHPFFDDNIPFSDSALVGKWQNAENPQWYKVYYDDYDDEGFYWGKEWDERDDVHEEDLNYHGSGWFRWKKDGKQLVEMHTMDVQDVPILKIWNVKHLTARMPNDSLVLTDADRKELVLHFSRR